MTTTDPFTEAAGAGADVLVDDIIRWDETVATDGPCDGTWDSLAEYLTGRGWARAHLAAQEPTDAEVLDALNAEQPWAAEDDLDGWPEGAVLRMRAALSAARAVGAE